MLGAAELGGVGWGAEGDDEGVGHGGYGCGERKRRVGERGGSGSADIGDC